MPAAEEPVKNEARLLLVSNRLPITIKRSEDGKYEYSMSSGGLASGLSGLSQTSSFLWYGWPGLQIPDDEVEGVKKKLKDDYGAIPIFIDDDLADKHYNGFSSPQSPSVLQARRLTSKQILYCGRCFIIIRERSLSTKRPGKLTSRQIVYLPKRWPKMCKMVIWSGFMTTTSCSSHRCSVRKLENRDRMLKSASFSTPPFRPVRSIESYLSETRFFWACLIAI